MLKSRVIFNTHVHIQKNLKQKSKKSKENFLKLYDDHNLDAV